MSILNINRVTLLGALSDPPEMKHLDSGRAMLKLRILTVERWEHNGEQKQRRAYHTAIVWGDKAERFARLNEGALVYVEGRLQTRSWEGPDGGKRYATEVVASEIQAGGDRGATGSPRQDRQQRGGGQRRGGYSGGGYGGPTGDDDFGDLPF